MFLERESALAALVEYAVEAARGEGRLVLVSGEAGVGKSALAERLEAELRGAELSGAELSGAPLSGAEWAWGACDGLFTPRPLAPLFDVAERLGGELRQLARAGAARDELFDRLLRHLHQPDRLHVVVLEDLHWADEATVDLVRFLGRRLRTAAALVVATYRDDALTARDPLRLALGELATQRSTRRIGLAPLSAAAVATLAAGSPVDPVELHRLTGGNPFYVTEVLRAGVAGGAGREELPASARDAVLARAARLTPPTREVLDVAALTGTRVEVGLLAAITAGCHDALDELIEAGLLVGDGPGLRFRHEIARLAVAQAVPPHRQVQLHARILAALEAADADDARLAFHAQAAGDAAAVLRYAPRAGRRAAVMASHREAAAQFERAVLALPATADPASAAGLFDALSSELSFVDRWEDAAVAGEQALELWRASGDPVRAGDMMRRLSRMMWRLCRQEPAQAYALAAVTELEPTGEREELAWAYANLAGQRMGERDDDALAWADRARAMAERLDLPAVRSDAGNTIGCVRAARGEDWTAELLGALDLALAHGAQSQAGRAYANIHAMFCNERRFTEAEPYFVDGVAYCDDHDMATYTTCLYGERTRVLEKTGRWAESAALAEELLGRVASPINRINPLLSLGVVRARRGESGVWACLDEAAAAADNAGEPEWIVAVRIVRAEALWLGGDPAAALAEAEQAERVADRADPWGRGAIAVWLRRLGATRTLPGELAHPYRLWLDGDWSAAAQAWTDLGCPYERALVRFDRGDEAGLRDSLRDFADLGAGQAEQVTRQRMRAAGIRSVPAGAQSATRAHPAGLTRREHQVLDLICTGRTNAEIAAELFISAKTVDHHVSAVLAKLGTPNRSAAATVAARLGLTVPAR